MPAAVAIRTDNHRSQGIAKLLASVSPTRRGPNCRADTRRAVAEIYIDVRDHCRASLLCVLDAQARAAWQWETPPRSACVHGWVMGTAAEEERKESKTRHECSARGQAVDLDAGNGMALPIGEAQGPCGWSAVMGRRGKESQESLESRSLRASSTWRSSGFSTTAPQQHLKVLDCLVDAPQPLLSRGSTLYLHSSPRDERAQTIGLDEAEHVSQGLLGVDGMI